MEGLNEPEPEVLENLPAARSSRAPQNRPGRPGRQGAEPDPGPKGSLSPPGVVVESPQWPTTAAGRRSSEAPEARRSGIPVRFIPPTKESSVKRLTMVALLLAAPVAVRANVLPAGKDCKEFQVGVTGIFARITGGVLSVTKTQPGTPAAGKLEAGDVLLTVDGASLEIQDPRHPLGFAINKAEGRDGKMTFAIRRGGEKRAVTIQLEAIGSYSPTFPAKCRKSRRIVDETAAFILARGGPGGGITGNLEGLFLISTGEKKYMPAVEAYALALAAKDCGWSVWHIGYSGMFLGEYYLATGDKRVLPALKQRCDRLAAGQYFGGWGHNANRCGPGYVTGGLLHAAGDQALVTLVLARECGVRVSQTACNDALKLFFRYAGRGGVPYGDHHPELWWSSNGKNGGLAAALTLLPDRKFQAAAQLLALSDTDTYHNFEGGHGSTFGNLTWRNVIDVLVPEHHRNSYRRHKDKMIWYFELSRMPGGGFRTPYYPGYGPIGRAPTYQTGLIAMGFTAQRKNLRICGKPRTKHSVPHKPTDVERSLPYTDSLRTDWVEGVVCDLEPHEIDAAFSTLYGPDGKKLPRRCKCSLNHDRKKKYPVEWYARLMRHYAPTVRDWASHGLGFQGERAVPEILKALESKDGRLRIAGLDAISGSTGWSPGKTKMNITPEMIRKHFLPYILRPLKDPAAAMWEKRHALMAMSCADAATITRHLDIITPYFAEDEWWLRVAAFTAMHPLIGETETFRKVLPTLLASYDADRNLPSRRWGATNLFKKAIADNPQLKEEIVAGMARSVNAMTVREGFKQPVDLNNIFETMRYVNMKRRPEHVIPILPAIERIYPKLAPLPASWTIIGARWGNIGLAKAAGRLGKDARPVIASMKRIHPDLASRSKKAKHGETLQKAQDALEAAVKAYEGKYGRVEID